MSLMPLLPSLIVTTGAASGEQMATVPTMATTRVAQDECGRRAEEAGLRRRGRRA